MIKQKPGKKVFSHAVKSKAVWARKKTKKNVVGVVVVESQTREKNVNSNKNYEGYFKDLTKKVVEHRYKRMHPSQTSLLDLEAKYPELAAALREMPPSFAFPMLDGLYLTKKAFHGILVNHQRGSRTSYVDNLLKRLRKHGKELSREAIEILKIAELQGGFVTWDTILKGLTVRLQLLKEEEKRAMERELAFLVERLRATGENVDPIELELVDVETVHASCNTKILHGWRHKKRPANRAVNFLWALCPSCSTVLSLSEAELKPHLTT